MAMPADDAKPDLTDDPHDGVPGTQPAEAMTYDSLATMRPMATQAAMTPGATWCSRGEASTTGSSG